MGTLRRAIFEVRAQLGILGGMLLMAGLSHVGLLPPASALGQLLGGWFGSYGLPLVIACAFVENVVVFNSYFPGSVVILAAMALTSGQPGRAVATFVAIVGGSLAAHVMNYLIGRRVRGEGDSRRVGETARSGGRIFWIAFWHPHFAALATLQAGRAGTPMRTFVVQCLPAALTWYVFWAFTMYHVGKIAVGGGDWVVGVYLCVSAWLLWDLLRFVRKSRQDAGQERLPS